MQPTERSTKSIDCLNMAEISRICDYLEVPDLVRACLTIPRWDAILKFPSTKRLLQNYVEEIKWFDRKLFRLFLPFNHKISGIDEHEVILHHDAEEKVMQARLQTHGLPPNPYRAEVIISYIDDADSEHYRQQRDQICDFLRLNGFIIDNSNEVDMIVLIVYGHYIDKCYMEYVSCKLKSYQTLLILHVTEGFSNGAWISKGTYQYYCLYLPRVSSEYWRVWHIEKEGNEFRNLNDAVKWASCTFLPPSNEL